MIDPRRLVVEVRDPDLVRRAQIDHRDIDGLTLISRFNNVGAWSIALSRRVPAVDMLRRPSWGLVVTLDDEVLLSGPLWRAERHRSADDPVGTWTLSGYDDMIVLSDPLLYPSPTSADVTEQSGTAGSGYDRRTGVAETLMRQYLAANVGATSPAERRGQLVSHLTFAADEGRGGTVKFAARFDKPGEALTSMAVAGGGLGFRVRQMQFEVYEPRDLTGKARLDIDSGIDEETYSYEAPKLTRAIVAGQGEAAARQFVERSTAASLAAEATWGRRIEQFIDQRQTDDLGELAQAGDEALADGGDTTVGLQITPADTPDRQFVRDYYLGDRMTAVVDEADVPGLDLEVPVVVTEATVTLGRDGYRPKVTLGDPSAALRNPLLTALRRTTEQLRRVERLERRQ